MVDLLVDLGADCSATNWVDYTPTMLAVLSSDEVLEYLEAHGCESGITDPIANELLYAFAKHSSSSRRVDYLVDMVRRSTPSFPKLAQHRFTARFITAIGISSNTF